MAKVLLQDFVIDLPFVQHSSALFVRAGLVLSLDLRCCSWLHIALLALSCLLALSLHDFHCFT